MKKQNAFIQKLGTINIKTSKTLAVSGATTYHKCYGPKCPTCGGKVGMELKMEYTEKGVAISGRPIHKGPEQEKAKDHISLVE